MYIFECNFKIYIVILYYVNNKKIQKLTLRFDVFVFPFNSDNIATL